MLQARRHRGIHGGSANERCCGQPVPSLLAGAARLRVVAAGDCWHTAARHHVERVVREEVAACRAPPACKVRRPPRESACEPLGAVAHRIARRLAPEPLGVGLLPPDGRAVQVLGKRVRARLAEEDDVHSRRMHEGRVALLCATDGLHEPHELGTHRAATRLGDVRHVEDARAIGQRGQTTVVSSLLEASEAVRGCVPREQRVHGRTARRDRTPSNREALQVVADGAVLHRGGIRGACERRRQRAVDQRAVGAGRHVRRRSRGCGTPGTINTRTRHTD